MRLKFQNKDVSMKLMQTQSLQLCLNIGSVILEIYENTAHSSPVHGILHFMWHLH